MIRFLMLVAIMILPARLWSQVAVRGYVRSNGTYVAPHMRSDPDGNFWNNWSTIGNVNPYTGKLGWKTVDPNIGRLSTLAPGYYRNTDGTLLFDYSLSYEGWYRRNKSHLTIEQVSEILGIRGTLPMSEAYGKISRLVEEWISKGLIIESLSSRDYELEYLDRNKIPNTESNKSEIRAEELLYGKDTFTVGSSLSEVLRIQGLPDEKDIDSYSDTVRLRYISKCNGVITGLDEVTIVNGQVKSWMFMFFNKGGESKLKVRPPK